MRACASWKWKGTYFIRFWNICQPNLVSVDLLPHHTPSSHKLRFCPEFFNSNNSTSATEDGIAVVNSTVSAPNFDRYDEEASSLWKFVCLKSGLKGHRSMEMTFILSLSCYKFSPYVFSLANGLCIGYSCCRLMFSGLNFDIFIITLKKCYLIFYLFIYKFFHPPYDFFQNWFYNCTPHFVLLKIHFTTE